MEVRRSAILHRRLALRAVPASRPGPTLPRDRFFANDRYRATREWKRYEGTAQRELFRILRERFLARHAPATKWALDVGSGPGRFTGRLGAPDTPRRVAFDLGGEMLEELRTRWPRGPGALPEPELVRGDAVRPPFAIGQVGLVAGLGNLIGFAGDEAPAILESLTSMLTPGGTLLLEVAPGPGEYSRYLRRLPAGSAARLLRSPLSAVAARVAREGFREAPARKQLPGAFRRVDPAKLRGRLVERGFAVEEVVAVAPALGPDGARIQVVREDPKAWGHLLELEEALGRSPEHWPAAAAVLVAAVAPGGGGPAGEGEEGRVPQSEG
ncbi:MAG: class I SAM-dependent methyltransferase [Thermoplasmata archaeon]